jgi:hypothetical protein
MLMSAIGYRPNPCGASGLACYVDSRGVDSVADEPALLPGVNAVAPS